MPRKALAVNDFNDAIDYDQVSNSILRGRAALEEAENHIKLFEDFILESSISESKQLRNMSYHKKSNDSFNELTQSIMPEKVECNQNDYDLELNIIKTMLKENDKREHRDNYLSINPIRQFCEPWIRSNPDEFNDKPQSTLKRKRNFDPNNLAVARRAIVNDSIIEEELALKEAEEREKANFKARPLPGGSFVKNDPYALTKAALGKVSKGPRGPEGLRTSFTSNNRNIRKDASVLLARCDTPLQDKRQAPTNPLNYCLKKRSPRHSKKAKAAYDAISQIIKKTTETDVEQDPDSPSEEEQDLTTLHQHISKLQSQLNLKRIQCIEAIGSISNDDVDVIACGANEEMSKSYSNFVDNDKDNTGKNDEITLCSQDQCANPMKRPLTKRLDRKHKSPLLPLYDRHHLWLQRIEMKRKEAKEREEKELLKDVTGKPNLHEAKKSWIRAKEQHDGIMKSVLLVETSRKTEREEKERILREKHASEIERLKALSKEKNKSQKSGIDKEMQAVHIDKLSRPNVKIKNKYTEKPEYNSTLTKPGFQHHRQKQPKKNGGDRQSIKNNDKHNDKQQVSFADMNDKEFAKMLRKLKADAARGKHTIFETSEDVMEDEDSSSNTKESDSMDKDAEKVVKNEDDSTAKDSRFTSSFAQANLLAKMTEVMGDKSKNDITQQKPQNNIEVSNSFQYPYERYEAGEVNFFDRSSSSEIGRFRLRDAREFNADSLRRVSASDTSYTSNDGVWFLIGKKKECETCHVITILFSRSQFDEASAAEWWKSNKNLVLEPKSNLLI